MLSPTAAWYTAGHVVEFKGGGTRPAWKRVAGDGRYDSGSTRFTCGSIA